MKFIRIVDSLNYSPGIYGYKPMEVEEVSGPIDEKLQQASSILGTMIGGASGGISAVAAARIGTTVLGSITPLGIGISGAILAGMLLNKDNGLFQKNPDAETGKWGLQQQVEENELELLEYVKSSIIIHSNSISGNYKDAFKRPELYGTFENPKQLQKILIADGGNSEIAIMPVVTAQKCFKHINDGILSPGAYLPHPKKLNVLVPFETFHSILLKELDEEFIRFFACLGAKKINITTLEGVSIDGSGTVPTGKVKVTGDYQKDKVRDKEYEFYPESCVINNALENKVWIQDQPKMQTFYETRKSYRLKRFAENLSVDTSFGVDIDVLYQFNSNFNWKKESKYFYEVEFFSKQELEA